MAGTTQTAKRSTESELKKWMFTEPPRKAQETVVQYVDGSWQRVFVREAQTEFHDYERLPMGELVDEIIKNLGRSDFDAIRHYPAMPENYRFVILYKSKRGMLYGLWHFVPCEVMPFILNRAALNFRMDPVCGQLEVVMYERLGFAYAGREDGNLDQEVLESDWLIENIWLSVGEVGEEAGCYYVKSRHDRRGYKIDLYAYRVSGGVDKSPAVVSNAIWQAVSRVENIIAIDKFCTQMLGIHFRVNKATAPAFNFCAAVLHV